MCIMKNVTTCLKLEVLNLMLELIFGYTSHQYCKIQFLLFSYFMRKLKFPYNMWWFTLYLIRLIFARLFVYYLFAFCSIQRSFCHRGTILNQIFYNCQIPDRLLTKTVVDKRNGQKSMFCVLLVHDLFWKCVTQEIWLIFKIEN